MSKTFTQMVDRLVSACMTVDFKEAYIDTYKLAELLKEELFKGQEPVVIDEPDYHDEAMGCGLEDRNITDRYEAMRYGWDCAVSRMFEQIPDEPLYTHPAVAAPVEWREQLETIADILEADGDEWGCATRLRTMLSAAPATPADAVAKDAERYRWLRHADLDSLADANWGRGNEVWTGDQLDAAIDAAMQGEKK